MIRVLVPGMFFTLCLSSLPEATSTGNRFEKALKITYDEMTEYDRQMINEFENLCKEYASDELP